MLQFRHDIRDLQRLKDRHDPALVERALRRSLDATSRKAATHISRDLRGTYAIKARDVQRRLKIERVRRDATRALVYVGRRLPLEQFNPKRRWVSVEPRRKVKSGPRKGSLARRRGATVRVRKDKGRQVVPGGWYAKDHILRRADADDNASDPRIQFGPSIPGMVAHPATINSAQELVRRELQREFNGRLEHLLQQKTGQK
ncbi:hypothetical protein SAMN05216571_101410 [Onishia taeanensis]|uniref:Prophage minor tail protein Z (GPZ) n=1 Tax=Onishia taeanensis TaxID=284577 RepID=A0A1G7NHL8_9GAMM|nr:hypothetical protein [Halomonas taeanensis]SDF72740.1 hypothetical protein SAMN05216571_101410 [Halomonas taeanensis]